MVNLEIECPKCGNQSVIIDEILPDGSLVGACLHCDTPHEEASIYINHCWNCYGPIDSRVDQRSPRPNKGFVCRNCGYDLQGPVVIKRR
jgi:predicted nucleic-acid-binding Zn-ribbon protein